MILEGVTSTFATMDRSRWEPGRWTTEPDRVEWEHAGLPCRMHRANPTGFWRGYVGVPLGHPLHGKTRWEARQIVPAIDDCVHGGLTFESGATIFGDDWFFGFDCNHLGDGTPMNPGDGFYCAADEVQAHCNRLADFLAGVAS